MTETDTTITINNTIFTIRIPFTKLQIVLEQETFKSDSRNDLNEYLDKILNKKEEKK